MSRPSSVLPSLPPSLRPSLPPSVPGVNGIVSPAFTAWAEGVLREGGREGGSEGQKARRGETLCQEEEKGLRAKGRR